MRRLALALLLAAAGRASAAGAAPATHRWELDVFGGYGRLAWPGQDETTRWSHGGPAFAVTAAYRGPHFTHPFLDLAYVPIVSSGQDVWLGPGTGAISTEASTHALALSVGPGFDIAWLRLRAGVGPYFVTTSVSAQGTSTSSTATRLGYLLSAAAMVWDADPFALGLEARLVALNTPGQGIYQTSWAAGLTGRWDFIRD